MDDLTKDWETSPEYNAAFNIWDIRKRLSPYTYSSFEKSQEFRNARLAYKRRINGKTKADH